MQIKLVYKLVVLAFQLLVLNHLDFSAFIMPQMFITLLISMPLHWSKITQVFVGFGLGLIVDFFLASPGIHASACLWLVLLRIGILNKQEIKQQIANKLPYDMYSAGSLPYFYSTLILVFFYHFYIFWIQNIGAMIWYKYGMTTLISSFLALTIIAILQYVSPKRLS